MAHRALRALFADAAARTARKGWTSCPDARRFTFRKRDEQDWAYDVCASFSFGKRAA
jgi:hypothetical protein